MPSVNMPFQTRPLKTPARFWMLLALITSIRIVISASTALGNDEVYYWTYAQQLQWNYFDHPPFVAWLIRISTLNLSLHFETAVRAGAILCSGIGTWLIYQTGTFIHNEKAGWYAALLYSASFYSSIIAGTFILPDSPQLVFWLAGIFLLLRLNKATEQNLPTLKLWVLFGLSAGLCILCKVHGAFLWLAVVINVLLINRKLLRQKGLYVAFAISAVLVLPIILWNIAHDFITYTYHSDRVNPFRTGIHVPGFLREIGGEIFYNNPFVFLLIWSSIFAAISGRQYVSRQSSSILLACAMPLLFSPILISLFKDTLPHWSGPAYTCLILLSAPKLAADQSGKTSKIILASIVFFLFTVTAGLFVVNLYPGTLGSVAKNEEYGKGDPTLDLYGWYETGRLIDSVCRQDLTTRKITPGAPFVIVRWYPAAHLDFYAAPLTGQHTYGIGKIFDLHQYYWSNADKPRIRKGQDAYFIIPSNLYNKQEAEEIQSRFTSSATRLIMPIYRNGKLCKNILFFRLKGFR